jgi:cardiolipin synthase
VYDTSFARELERRFGMDVESSVEVKPEEWKRRGALQRMKEWLARRWEFLL